MNNAPDHAVAGIGLDHIMSLATSALPDAPVVPDIPRDSLVTRARRAIAFAGRVINRPAPTLPEHSAMMQG